MTSLPCLNKKNGCTYEYPEGTEYYQRGQYADKHKCKYYKCDGCDYMGNWSDVYDHEYGNNRIWPNIYPCKKRPMICDLCREDYPKCDMEDHVSHCPKRKVSCKLCSDEVTFDEYQEHTNDCIIKMLLTINEKLDRV